MNLVQAVLVQHQDVGQHECRYVALCRLCNQSTRGVLLLDETNLQHARQVEGEDLCRVRLRRLRPLVQRDVQSLRACVYRGDARYTVGGVLLLLVAEADLPGFGVAVLVVEDADYVLVAGFVFRDEHVLVCIDVLE